MSLPARGHRVSLREAKQVRDSLSINNVIGVDMAPHVGGA